MKKNMSRLGFMLIAVVGCLTGSARADLGLSQIFSDQGALAVGQAVLTAAKSIYAEGTTGAPKQDAVLDQLIPILNEAAATGNEQAVRYTIVAIMMAGEVKNLELSKTAINNSDIFVKYKTIMAKTVAETEALMNASGGGGSPGVGLKDDGSGGSNEGGGDTKNQGGGFSPLFQNDPVPPDVPTIPRTSPSRNDKDNHATRT